jgi:hypothetical protein
VYFPGQGADFTANRKSSKIWDTSLGTLAEKWQFGGNIATILGLPTPSTLLECPSFGGDIGEQKYVLVRDCYQNKLIAGEGLDDRVTQHLIF